MAQYTIYVDNGTSSAQNYLFFNAVPQGSTTLGQAWSNVWLTNPGTAPNNHGQATFVIKADDFAVCGTTSTPLNANVNVFTTDYESVTTDPGSTVSLTIVSGGPELNPSSAAVTTANSYAIQSGEWDPAQYNNIYCGYGKYDKSNNVVPVAVWPASPNQIYDVTPVVTFYVSTGDYEPGTTVDVTTFGTIGTIDFTTAPAGATYATITQNADNTYSDPVFSFAPPLQRTAKDV